MFPQALASLGILKPHFPLVPCQAAPGGKEYKSDGADCRGQSTTSIPGSVLTSLFLTNRASFAA